MVYDKEKLLELLNELFGETYWNYSDGLCEDAADEFLESISSEDMLNYDYEIGATKLVFIPAGYNYVIKIPYNLACYEGDTFDFFGLPEEFTDYCEYEVSLYNKAKENGWEQFFLPIEYVGKYKGIPIYIQQKAEAYRYSIIDYATEDSKQAILTKRKEDKNFLPLSLPFDWVACCLDVLHSLEKVRNFFCFLENEKISRDLHKGNIGFYKNKPVIIDYGGYFEY